MAQLLLIRHGESEWNALGRWQGRADPPLSAEGAEQARRAAERLADLRIDGIVSSPLRRASQTAAILLEGTALEAVEHVPSLAERDVGEWSGLTSAEVDERWPGLRAGGGLPAGWESDESLCSRVLPALLSIGARPGIARIAVVTHGGVIRAVEELLRAPGPIRTPHNLGARWIVVEQGALALGSREQLLPERT